MVYKQDVHKRHLGTGRTWSSPLPPPPPRLLGKCRGDKCIFRVRPLAREGGILHFLPFAFTVSHHHLDSLKPWYLTLTDAKTGPTTPFSVSLGSALVSPFDARSLYFVSPAAQGGSGCYAMNPRKGLFPSTLLPRRVTPRIEDPPAAQRTPGPRFLHSPGGGFLRGEPRQGQVGEVTGVIRTASEVEPEAVW
ncbi:hypothetical protein MLD38_016910 [Melastoma candidum]|uniref:Uncharacterized protein n=1 Tax=Melastoma candidum TaxID=119954 RepID=A0ACB9QQ78_9MYRT|nr:hypothetical protein MLD38_016910 [Melastoma candidum]